MKRALIAELKKVAAARSFRVLALVSLGLVVVVVSVTIRVADGADVATDANAALAVGMGFFVTSFVLLFAGVTFGGAEHRHHTLGPSLCLVPRRRLFAAVKVVAGSFASVGLAACGSAVAAATFATTRPSRDPGTWDGVASAVGLGLVATFLLVAIAVSIGIAIPHQAAALGGVAVYYLIIESVLVAVHPRFAGILAIEAVNQLASGTSTAGSLLTPLVALIAWATAGLVLATTTLHRRQVT